MIKVRRSTVSVPTIFSSVNFRYEKRRAREFFSLPIVERDQRSFDWTIYTQMMRRADCLEKLSRLFHGKCAYCESSILDQSLINIEYFRPRDGAMGLDGSFSPDHYWWLVFEWSNMLPSCQLCDSAKAQRFPVARTRAAAGALGTKLDLEQPFLLDPCKDDPELHLFFARNGFVSSVTPRGRCAIEVLALNREPLVQMRFQQIEDLHETIRSVIEGMQTAIHRLREALSSSAPFLAAKRQLVRSYVAELRSVLTERDWTALQVHGGNKKHSMNLGGVTKSETRFRRLLKSKQNHSVEDDGDAARRAYFSGKRRIERIEIHNFKKIRNMELTLPSASERESWLVMVGENATGKSSLLQAVGLALLGQAHLQKLGLDARNFVTEGEEAGFVKVYLTNVLGPVELRFNANSRLFRVNPTRELVLLLGYGATRLLPRSARKDQKTERYVRVKNLFDPYARLQHAERWLTDVDRLPEREFSETAKALKRLLMLTDEDVVRREGAKVLFEVGQGQFSLRRLSDGYQSIVALAVDIMMGLSTKWGRMDLAEGIVLIDEIETHLHPIWKMEIVSRFRTVFPRLQFLVTTHDPLCLRGLFTGEVVVFKSTRDRLQAESVKEDISHLRADQLLTSPLFGLVSTREPAFQIITDRYSELLGMVKLTDQETREMNEIGHRLQSGLLKGETPSEQSVESVVRETVNKFVESAISLPPSQSANAGSVSHQINERLSKVFG